jgi:hypothetical protein
MHPALCRGRDGEACECIRESGHNRLSHLASPGLQPHGRVPAPARRISPLTFTNRISFRRNSVTDAASHLPPRVAHRALRGRRQARGPGDLQGRWIERVRPGNGAYQYRFLPEAIGDGSGDRSSFSAAAANELPPDRQRNTLRPLVKRVLRADNRRGRPTPVRHRHLPDRRTRPNGPMPCRWTRSRRTNGRWPANS